MTKNQVYHFFPEHGVKRCLYVNHISLGTAGDFAHLSIYTHPLSLKGPNQHVIVLPVARNTAARRRLFHTRILGRDAVAALG